MRAAFWVGCAALLLSACSSEPVQQATAAHVSPGMRAAMSSSGQANCAMVGGALSVARQLDGSTIGMCALPNGKRCSEQALADVKTNKARGAGDQIFHSIPQTQF